jgi:hypothetical protein
MEKEKEVEINKFYGGMMAFSRWREDHGYAGYCIYRVYNESILIEKWSLTKKEDTESPPIYMQSNGRAMRPCVGKNAFVLDEEGSTPRRIILVEISASTGGACIFSWTVA